MDSDSRKRKHGNLPLLLDMRLDRLLGERKLSWIRCCRHWKLRRPEFPRADYRRVGGDTAPVGLLASRHAAQANAETGMTKNQYTNTMTARPSLCMSGWGLGRVITRV